MGSYMSQYNHTLEKEREREGQRCWAAEYPPQIHTFKSFSNIAPDRIKKISLQDIITSSGLARFT